MASEVVAFQVNGRPVEVLAGPLVTLNGVLREQLGLTAAKAGCRQGGCGSCTVLVDGEPMLSCLLPVANVRDRAVSTLEGMEGADPLQQAFHESFAVQCGYCAPGMLVAARSLLDRNPKPTRDEIKLAIAGNVCRCTGYDSIIDAIASVAAGTEHPDPVEPERAAS